MRLRGRHLSMVYPFLVALELDLDAGDGVVVGAVDQQAVLLLHQAS